MKKRLLRLTNVLLLPLLFLLLMAVSLNGRAQELSITKLDYSPGETVYITGTGWASGEVVTLKVDHLTYPIPDHGTPDPHASWTATADAGGTFTSTWYVNDFELGAELRLVAIGISGYTYEIFFTDGNVKFDTTGLPDNTSVTVNYSYGIVSSSITWDTGSGEQASSNIYPTPANNTIFTYTFPETISASNNIYQLTPSGSQTVTIPNPAATYLGTYVLVGGSGNLTVTAPECAQGGSFNITYTPANGNAVTETRSTPYTFTVKKNTSYSINSIASPINGNIYDGTTPVTGTTPNANDFTATVTLAYSDNTNPVISNMPANITVYSNDGNTASCTQIATWDEPSASDNCSVSSFTSDHQSGDAFPVGETVVTYTAVDASSNASTASFTVTVIDNTKPIIYCPATLTIATDNGECYATISEDDLGDPDTNDNCGVESTTSNFAILFQNGQVPFGTHIITWTVEDIHGNTNSCEQTIDVNRIKTVTTVIVDPIAQQYSDKVTLRAKLTPFNCSGSENAAASVTFKIGTQIMGTVNLDANGEATGTYALLEPTPFGTAPTGQMAPNDAQTVTAVFNSVNDDFMVNNATTTLDINCENAQVTYNGSTFFAANPNNGQGNVTLSAYVVDNNDVVSEDGARGDIRNATMTFKDGSTTLGTANIPVGLINPVITTEGFATTDFNYTLSKTDLTEGGVVWEVLAKSVSTSVNNYYCGETDAPTLVTLGMPGSDYVTGGGYIVMKNTSGIYGGVGTEDKRMNFGFVMKWNKSGKSLQGRVNAIYRRVENNIKYNYQIKSNAINSLVIETVDANGVPTTTASAIKFKRATINTKANLTRLNPDGSSTSMGGNLSLLMVAWESTTDLTGKSDKVSIQVAGEGGSGILFSSYWVEGKTIWQTLDGGKIQVKTPGTLKSAEIATAVAPEIIAEPGLKVYPNPFTDRLNIEFSSATDGMAKLEIFGVTGAKLATLYNGPVEAGVLNTFEYVPAMVSSQMVFYHLTIDGKTQVGKAIFQEKQ